MEEQEKTDYVKGFNQGYTISKHFPELAKQLSRAVGDGVRFVGMQDGRKEYLQEQVKSIRPDWLKEDRSEKSEKAPDKSIDKDIDHSPDR